MDRAKPIDATKVKEAVPFLRIADMARSLRFYVDGLGFTKTHEWIDEGTVRWCSLSRGGASLMLQDFRTDGGKRWAPEGPLGLGVSVMFLCEDAVAFYREVTNRGVPAERPFVGNGMWVTSLRDPDGYRIEFESPTSVAEDTVLEEGGPERPG